MDFVKIFKYFEKEPQSLTGPNESMVHTDKHLAMIRQEHNSIGHQACLYPWKLKNTSWWWNSQSALYFSDFILSLLQLYQGVCPTKCWADWLPWALSTKRHGDAQGHTAGSSKMRSCLCCPHYLTRNSVPSQVELVPLSFHLLSNPLIGRDMVLLCYDPPSIGLAAPSCIQSKLLPAQSSLQLSRENLVSLGENLHSPSHRCSCWLGPAGNASVQRALAQTEKVSAPHKVGWSNRQDGEKTVTVREKRGQRRRGRMDGVDKMVRSRNERRWLSWGLEKGPGQRKDDKGKVRSEGQSPLQACSTYFAIYSR